MNHREKNVDFPKIFFGPMSKEAVDCITNIAAEEKVNLGLIPSRRQIETERITPGYVNHWTTESFMSYLDNRVVVQRDHAGPSQGHNIDDGTESIQADIEAGILLIHIDPWKVSTSIEDAIERTHDMMAFSSALSEDVRFEVGTEEAIRKISAKDLNKFLSGLRNRSRDLFAQIIFCVVQSGTSINENKNIGRFNYGRSKRMCDIVRRYGLVPKEHNSDYLTASDFYLRKLSGVESFNVAPELGVLQTTIVMKNLLTFGLQKEKNSFARACEVSNKWEKWTTRNCLSPEEKAILCGHYNFMTNEWKECLSSLEKYMDITVEIESALQQKIRELIWTTA